MKYKIAGIIVELEPIFEILRKRAEKYQIETIAESEFSITVTDEQFQKAKESDFTLSSKENEYLIAGTNFYRNLLNKNGCLLHASAVVIDDEAYLFSANSRNW